MAELESAYALSREALYELVWSAPMVQLARRFGLSDQGLRKICVKQQVPLPQAGYWAKIAAGHAPSQVALQPFSEKTAKAHFVEKQIQRRAAKASKAVEWQPPMPTSTAAPQPVSWHPVLKDLRQALKAYVKKMEFAKSVYDWEEAHPGKLYPGKGKDIWLHGNWRSMCNNGQIVTDTHKITVLRVSLGSHERALRLLNDFARKASKRGYQLEMEEFSRALRVSRGRQQVSVRVSEKMKAIKETQDLWGRQTLTQVLVPTGRLSLIVEGGGCGHVLSEETGLYLEQTVDALVENIGERMDVVAKADAEAALLQRERGERARVERERLAAEAKEHQRVEALAAEEAARRVALLDEAKRWKEASLIREYLAALDAHASSAESFAPGFQRWRDWAHAVADDMDCFGLRVGNAIN